MTHSRFQLLGPVFAAFIMTVGAGASADAAGFKPHRAVYDLTLKEASSRSGIDGISGRIVYEFTGSKCDGFASRYRFSTDVQLNGKVLNNDQRSTTFESADGKRFDFITQYFLNGQQEQDLRGSAERSDAGIVVKIAKPDEQTVELEPAIFMSQHLAKILDAAAAGETIVAAKLFDGSDDADELVDTTAIIGKRREVIAPPAGEPAKVTDKFNNAHGWPVTVSYFSHNVIEGGGEKLPGYQVSFILHEDGVSRDLTMQYEDYALKGVLADIEYLKAEPCDK